MANMLSDANFLTLLAEGFLSVFSPCVLPIIPIYFGYISSSGTSSKSSTLIKTLFFTLGICTTFVVLGLGANALSQVFVQNSGLFKLIGGIILILFSLITLNIIHIPALDKLSLKNKVKVDGEVSMFKSWLLGFVFSFNFTPCVGPMLMQALLMASQAGSKLTGWLYILAYSIGFIVVFLLLGLFTDKFLSLLKKHKNIVKYTSVIAGILILVSGIMMSIDGYRELRQPAQSNTPKVSENSTNGEETVYTLEMLDFDVLDNEGNSHKITNLADDGKVTILYFSQTWCTYCAQMTPILDELHNEFSDNLNVILVDAIRGEQGKTIGQIIDHYKTNYNISYDAYIDQAGATQSIFGVSGYPTLYIFDKSDTLIGYVPGFIEYETLKEVVTNLIAN